MASFIHPLLDVQPDWVGTGLGNRQHKMADIFCFSI